MSKNIAYLYIVLAAALWGIIGFFITNLYELGFTPIQVVAVRALSATFFLILYICFKNWTLLKIKVADSKYFVGTGILSIVFFNLCFFNAIQETSLSVAAILLYTAPVFVTILSRFMFKEFLSARKISALFITMLGCSFVIGIIPSNKEIISLYGLLLGLGAGFFYSLYGIFGKFALRKYDSITVTAYTFVFAAVAITPFSDLWSHATLFLNAEVWLYIVGIGFLSTMMAFILYTKALRVIETSRASIIATIEPVIAAIVSFLAFQEKLEIWQCFGICLVIIAVIMVQEPVKTDAISIDSSQGIH